MKLTKLGKKLAGAIVISGILAAGSAFAGVNCPTATITKTGVYPYLPGTVQYAVYAECTGTWTGELMFFVADDTNAESLYAAALTAVSTGNTSDLLITGATAANYATVKMLSVSNTP